MGMGEGVFVARDVPPRLGVIPFQKKHGRHLQRALCRKYVPKLHEEFLSDAQESAFQGNIRRAVLELAIACEVAVKGKFFGRSTGGRTLDYLKDQRNVQVRVLELVDRAAREVFGESFKDSKATAYTDLDYLFQCRNKVAHRGRPVFRDERGTMQTATVELLERWLNSARVLFVWMKTLK
jgi:hypothetical protein